MLLLYRSSRPHVAVLGRLPDSGAWADASTHPESAAIDGVTVLRVESGLFFANADYVRAAISRAAAADRVRAVVLDCETVPFIDVTAARMLDELAVALGRQPPGRQPPGRQPPGRQGGVRLVVARGVGQVRDVLGTGAPDEFSSVREAVEALRPPPPASDGCGSEPPITGSLPQPPGTTGNGTNQMGSAI